MFTVSDLQKEEFEKVYFKFMLLLNENPKPEKMLTNMFKGVNVTFEKEKNDFTKVREKLNLSLGRLMKDNEIGKKELRKLVLVNNLEKSLEGPLSQVCKSAVEIETATFI